MGERPPVVTQGNTNPAIGGAAMPLPWRSAASPLGVARSLYTRHDLNDFVNCHLVVGFLVEVVLCDRVLWISRTIALEGALSINRSLQPGKLSCCASRVRFV